ncbi:N-6 DNA methylase [Segniliparus rotundus DSM 44985]|uniref:N-6 DNA methylase n=1 Tax=Segniliparus rotundus (strain ATCC BAA-972 / CDC 1076 / CIP 108378 / DSM 44985 / JCM 13578) TaxID=640132 RepID=D6ZCZ1_SEGRD|nr:N-6 DNA methylase [Segniliparus rotundus]ADG99178.1 N-6 DNA methylase [Segniliparus rotundus DSM 44985]
MPAKPKAPKTDFAENGSACHRSGSLIWQPLRSTWVDITHRPEEVVRQEWVRRLAVDGRFDLAQMDQERRTLSHGLGSPRADIVVWPSADAKADGAGAILVVETKAAAGPVILTDFRQGESYARAGGSSFLIAATANAHAVYELTPGFPGKARQINDWPTRADFTDEKKLAALRDSLRSFDREEFQKLLFDCHSLLRDHHAMTPDRAFDTISKVLFIKLHIERSGAHGTFTTNFLDDREKTRLTGDAPVHELLFEATKDAYKTDELFDFTDVLDISDATFRALVQRLQRFNLSKTGDDIKGIAFERFLGRTFRGELGQFFTPRPVVDFMIEALDPQEGELICDPAAGSGGFLIRAFDHVRSSIASDIERQKNDAYATITAEYAQSSTEEQLEQRDRQIDAAFAKLNEELSPTDSTGAPARTRVGLLSWDCIYGTDKEPRAARTAKMNMIMHGDGHGGIHWHDGLVNINGIFPGRFHVVVTNPPFGASVTSAQRIGATTESDVPNDPAYARRQFKRYGDDWKISHDAVVNARGTPILDQFEIGRGKNSRQTETLFVERCLNLLKPGGRLAIVLPNGNLNAMSLDWLRRWVEGKAFLRGVVALPPETFKFSKASVSASIVFLDKFTDVDAAAWQAAWMDAEKSTTPQFDAQRSATVQSHEQQVVTAFGDDALTKILTQLDELGITRALPPYVRSPAAGLDYGAGRTTIGVPRWTDSSNRSRIVIDLKKEYTDRARSLSSVITRAVTDLRASLKGIDDAHTAAMWEFVRVAFDYPVFMATPTNVGITATGETGERVANDLPDILKEWHRFRIWCNNGFPDVGF